MVTECEALFWTFCVLSFLRLRNAHHKRLSIWKLVGRINLPPSLLSFYWPSVVRSAGFIPVADERRSGSIPPLRRPLLSDNIFCWICMPRKQNVKNFKGLEITKKMLASPTLRFLFLYLLEHTLIVLYQKLRIRASSLVI